MPTNHYKNWPRYKKLYTLFLCAIYACVMGFGENILGAAWTEIAEETNVSLTNMNGASGLNWLLLGFANLIWIPIAMKFGRKIVYIASLIIMVVMYTWSAVFTGTGQWYGACALGGLGTSAYQALIQLTIMDVFFAHERGTMLAFYLWGQQLGAILGLILGGYIAEGPGWRWGENICAILCVCTCRYDPKTPKLTNDLGFRLRSHLFHHGRLDVPQELDDRTSNQWRLDKSWHTSLRHVGTSCIPLQI